MSIKHLRGNNDSLNDQHKERMNVMIRSITTLTHNNFILNQLMDIANTVLDQDRQRLYNRETLEELLNNFENDISVDDDKIRLQNIQKLYSVMQLYFMRKAGINVYKRDPDTDEDEGLGLKKKEKVPLEKDSPLKVNADKARVEKPGGDKKN